MADTSIARSALGATTTNRKWFLDVWDGGLAAYVGVFGIQEFKPVKAATTQDTSDFSSVWKGNQVNALSWSLEGKLKRATTAASDPTAFGFVAPPTAPPRSGLTPWRCPRAPQESRG